MVHVFCPILKGLKTCPRLRETPRSFPLRPHATVAHVGMFPFDGPLGRAWPRVRQSNAQSRPSPALVGSQFRRRFARRHASPAKGNYWWPHLAAGSPRRPNLTHLVRSRSRPSQVRVRLVSRSFAMPRVSGIWPYTMVLVRLHYEPTKASSSKKTSDQVPNLAVSKSFNGFVPWKSLKDLQLPMIS